jgi:hypothetical protein
MVGSLRNATAFATTESPLRWTIQNGAMDIVVLDPRQVSERIRQLAADAGGFTVTSETRGANLDQSASVTIRVPQARFTEFHEAIRKMAIHVDGEHFEAQDVTKQYVDKSSRLRNLRAQPEDLGLSFRPQVMLSATVSTCLESASNSACCCSISPRTSFNLSPTSSVSFTVLACLRIPRYCVSCIGVRCIS